VAMFEVVSQR